MKTYKVGDTVRVEGYTSFCTPYDAKVRDIITKYDEDTGKPYPVYVMNDGDTFDGRDGSAIKGATMYYIDLEDKAEPNSQKGDNVTGENTDDLIDLLYGDNAI
jgi:hypothetical protein